MKVLMVEEASDEGVGGRGSYERRQKWRRELHTKATMADIRF